MSLPKLPWTTRLGAIGESEVKARLQYFSNPVKYELDVGIDFYCELLENDSPTTPFYVQAKSTDHFDTSWGASIDKSTIAYWLERPFPVFLVVYDENKGVCHWTSIEDQRQSLLDKLKTSSASTIYMKVGELRILEKGKRANEVFIHNIKDDQISVDLWRGQSRFKGEGWVGMMPSAPRSDIELARIRENLRMNMYSLIQHYFESEELDDAFNACEFLVKFDKSHYNQFVMLAVLNKLRGNPSAAREYYKQALDICERDKTWPKESMDRLKEAIRAAMDRL